MKGSKSKNLFATTAKSLQSSPTLCNPIDGSLLGSSVPVLQGFSGSPVQRICLPMHGTQVRPLVQEDYRVICRVTKPVSLNY